MYEPGHRIGNYEVVRSLGSGGQGVVYLCRHVMLDRLDAVKVLLAQHAGSADARKRFEREAASAARLRHPNIITVHDAGTAENGDFYVAMQFIDGLSLDRLIKATGMADLTRALRVLDAIAKALDAAHAIGLIHRDVKPNNILLSDPMTPREHAYLADFGVAKLVESRDSTMSQVMGTYGYMAPERIDGQTGDGSADQYSLACTAFQCLTGSLPYPGTTTSAVIKGHVLSPPPEVTTLRPDLPEELNAVFAMAMAKAPADRYPSCPAFIAALRSALVGGEPVADSAPRTEAPQTVGPSAPVEVSVADQTVKPADDERIPEVEPAIIAETIIRPLAETGVADQTGEPPEAEPAIIAETVIRPLAETRIAVRPAPVEIAPDDLRGKPVTRTNHRNRNLLLIAAAAVVVGVALTFALWPTTIPPNTGIDTVTVSVGKRVVTPEAECKAETCAYVEITLDRFPPSTPYSCSLSSSNGSIGIPDVTGNTDSSGHADIQTDYWYGTSGSPVFVVCNGHSDRITWP